MPPIIIIVSSLHENTESTPVVRLALAWTWPSEFIFLLLNVLSFADPVFPWLSEHRVAVIAGEYSYPCGFPFPPHKYHIYISMWMSLFFIFCLLSLLVLTWLVWSEEFSNDVYKSLELWRPLTNLLFVKILGESIAFKFLVMLCFSAYLLSNFILFYLDRKVQVVRKLIVFLQ